MVGSQGFKPWHIRLRGECSTAEPRPCKTMSGRMWRACRDSNPDWRLRRALLYPVELQARCLAAGEGFEPVTRELTAHRSTAELLGKQIGGPGRTRTYARLIKRQLLSQLSYEPGIRFGQAP